jgi:hypothetical protein
LWVVLLQRVGEAVGNALRLVYEQTSLFNQTRQCAHGSTLWLEGLELVAVADEKFELILGIGGVILGMTWCEGFAVFRQRCRIDREQDQEIVLLQRIDQRPLGELQAHRHGPTLEAFSERASPLINGIGTMNQDVKLSRVGIGNLQADIVLPISPIDANKGRKFIVELMFHDSSGTLR